jgi:hypothetical protein
MKRSGPSIELKALTRSVKEVEDRFLRPHLASAALGPPSRQEILDVAAYVVLVHGSLEGFAEALAHWLLGRSVKNWTYKKRTTRCTASLLLYQKAPPTDREFTAGVRNAHAGVRDAHSSAVLRTTLTGWDVCPFH